MADSTNGKNPEAGAAAQGGQPQIQAAVVGQYIKDLSFENPAVSRLIADPGEAPKLQLEIDVNAQRMSQGQDLYESAIDFRAVAANPSGTIYEMQLVYAGLFKIQNIPEQALEPFLLINCPTLLFPFVRRLVADISREGGFPPLLLDPIDFGALYVRRKQQQAAQEAAGKAKS